jgi:hypothetical protein
MGEKDGCKILITKTGQKVKVCPKGKDDVSIEEIE